ncbi:hypothetical protein VAEKB19_3900032 [Vibrio aestuarianus]|nr:hypothetical protein VAEKB19_3900032 [Vibrio aestuarianus]
MPAFNSLLIKWLSNLLIIITLCYDKKKPTIGKFNLTIFKCLER